MKNLETIWSKAAALGQTLKEYPRPDMVRRHWINLNGMWDYLITDSRILPWQFYKSEYFPFDGQILVPFSPEAPLSQVKRQLLPDETLWYSRTIQLPENCLNTESQRLLLHFGAVDQICSVYINRKFVTYHKGGYLPFTTDITDFITEDLTVSILISVHDFSDTSYHARGKQQLKRGGMFYTAQSGIWQTVWMEIVPNEYIRDVRVTPDWDNSLVRMRIRVSSASSAENASPAHISPTAADQTDSQGTVLAFSPDRQNSSNVICKVYPPVFLEADGLNDTLCQDEITTAAIRPGKGATLSIPENMQKSWTPKEPWLYPYSLEYGKDRILGYFALRKCDVQIADDNYPRFFLNNQPYFQSGVLDQGYWPDGLYTAPSDEALIYDIRAMKDLGFNMLRKHGKIETDRWYFHCDRMGMLVWQDMPSGAAYPGDLLAVGLPNIGVQVSDKKHKRFKRENTAARLQFTKELKEMVEALTDAVCICTWVPFNEGWGQFDAAAATALLWTLDPTRPVDHASGWHDQGAGDYKSIHKYIFKVRPPHPDGRAFALTEYGGYSQVLDGHVWDKENSFGYRMYPDKAALTAAYRKLHEEQILPLLKKGLCVSIYTQLTDVELEVNGLFTYDRAVCKLDEAVVKEINQKLVL